MLINDRAQDTSVTADTLSLRYKGTACLSSPLMGLRHSLTQAPLSHPPRLPLPHPRRATHTLNSCSIRITDAGMRTHLSLLGMVGTFVCISVFALVA